MRRCVLLGIFGVAALVGAAQPTYAGCATDLADCYYRAANVDGFWYRWAAGIDCELDFVECTRVKLIGG